MVENLRSVWAASILLEAVLLIALIHRRRYRERPVFAGFVALDWLRSLAMFGVWLWGSRHAYGFWFMLSEPPDMIALCAAGIEAFGHEVQSRSRWSGYVAVIGFALVMGYCLPPVQNLPLNRMFMQRSLITFTICGALIISAAWRSQMLTLHGNILLIFCLFDLIAYLSLALYPEWGRRHPVEAPLLVMSGQAGCLSAWAIKYSS